MLQFPYISEIFLNFVKWNIEVFKFSFIYIIKFDIILQYEGGSIHELWKAKSF